MMYNLNMAKMLLIGKDIPEGYDFAKGLAGAENQVFCAESDSNTDSGDLNERIFTASWNKASAISAHSLLIKAETRLETIENVIFYFDADYLSSRFLDNSTDEISTAIDTMITPFLYITAELLRRAEQKGSKLCAGFIVKNLRPEQTSGIVKIAEAAFCQLAENFAQNVSDRDYLRVFLAKSSALTEAVAGEAALGEWAAKALGDISDKKQSVKQATAWNKAGAKLGAGFPFFK